METGGLICRGVQSDGSPDMYSADLKCGADPSVSVDSEEGYELLCCEMRDFAAFLTRHGWQDKVLFHVMDEPDVHVRSDAGMQARRTQFFLAANIVRRYLPGVRIIEAVKTTLFRGGVDIMVPITDGYEREKKNFDAAMALGDEVWTYVCCGPEESGSTASWTSPWPMGGSCSGAAPPAGSPGICTGASTSFPA